MRGLYPRRQPPPPSLNSLRSFRATLSHKGRGEGRDMQDQTLPTVAESAMRGLACKCPRCGKGKLYAGFLDLRPNCGSCGLDYAFIDPGDGSAIFLIMIAGALV